MRFKPLSEKRAAAVPFDQSSYALVRRLLRDYVRHHAGTIAMAVVFMIVFAAASAAFVYLLKPALDDVLIARDQEMLKFWPVVILIVSLVIGFSQLGQAVLMQKVGLRVIADMQDQMFAHLMRADLQFFHDNATGKLIARFTNDVNLLRGGLTSSLTGLVKDVLHCAFLLGLLFYHDWIWTLTIFVVFPIAVIPIVKIGQRMRRISRQTQGEVARFTTLLDQVFQGARHVKSYGMEDYERRRAKGLIESIFGLYYRAAWARAIGHPIMETLGGGAFAAVVYLGGSQVIAGETTPGTLVSFIGALIMAYRPLKSILNLNANLQEGLAAAQRVFYLLDVEPDIVDRPDARKLEVAGGSIRFDGVSFEYADDKPALKGVSLTVPAGRTAALVGPSGGGKSTILNLIPRFYEVQAGGVSIDGADVRDVTLASLRANIALVSQEVSLFDDTVRANIAYGRPGAGEDEIEQAARDAAAHGFIVDLPDGYDTVVGEHGVKLSGGQRQRIAIARAMLKNAPILLLDEATSALDTDSERQVQAALAELMRGRTTLIVAHRLSTVADADILYVVENGKVVESGSHAELIRHGGLFARLASLQSADEPSPDPDAARVRA